MILALVGILATGFTGAAKAESYAPQTRDFTVAAALTMVQEMRIWAVEVMTMRLY